MPSKPNWFPMTRVIRYKRNLSALHRQIFCCIKGWTKLMHEATCVSYLKLMNSMIWQVENFQIGQLPINQNFLALSIPEANRAEIDRITTLVIRA